MIEDSKTEDCQCPVLDRCAFVSKNRDNMPELVNRIQNNYCLKPAYSDCARFHVCQALDCETVPPLMLPDQVRWAQQVIAEHEDAPDADDPS